MYKTDRVATGTLATLEDLVLEDREVVTTRSSGLVLRERRRVMKGTLSADEREQVAAILRGTNPAVGLAAGAATLPASAPGVAFGAEPVSPPDPGAAVDRLIREIEAADGV